MYYLNANNIYFNLKEKKSQAKAILNKHGKKEKQNILHANSVKYLQSFCFFSVNAHCTCNYEKSNLKKVMSLYQIQIPIKLWNVCIIFFIPVST